MVFSHFVLALQLLLQHYFPTLPNDMAVHPLIYTETDCMWLLQTISATPFKQHHGWTLITSQEASRSGGLVGSGRVARTVQRACCHELFTLCMAEYWMQQLLQAASQSKRQEEVRLALTVILFGAFSSPVP